jgi:ribulose-bisphosphate carboxylase large chain
MTDDSITAVYRVRARESDLPSRLESLLLEQTVELPRSALRPAFARKPLVGRVVGATQIGPDLYRATLAQPALAAGNDPAQLLNVLFGNCSLQPDIELEDVGLPAGLAATLGGPRFGVAGIRSALGIHGRVLTASVLKPVGLSVAEAAALCRTLAQSGLDIIKDDHGLADHPFCPFAERVEACLGATEEAARETGGRAVYVPNLIGTPQRVMAQASTARRLGARAVMVSPMLLGLPFLNELAAGLGIPILAHPSFAGSLRISAPALLGKLFPFFGADAVIYPNYGGRFSYSRDECASIARALREPDAAVKPAFPVPAGGIKFENIGEVLGFYGADAILLLGGSLLDCPDHATLLSRARQFVAAAHRAPHPP